MQIYCFIHEFNGVVFFCAHLLKISVLKLVFVMRWQRWQIFVVVFCAHFYFSQKIKTHCARCSWHTVWLLTYAMLLAPSLQNKVFNWCGGKHTHTQISTVGRIYRRLKYEVLNSIETEIRIKIEFNLSGWINEKIDPRIQLAFKWSWSWAWKGHSNKSSARLSTDHLSDLKLRWLKSRSNSSSRTINSFPLPWKWIVIVKHSSALKNSFAFVAFPFHCRLGAISHKISFIVYLQVEFIFSLCY